MDRPRPANDAGSIVIRVTIKGQRHAIRHLGRYDDTDALRQAKLIAETLWSDMLSDRVLPDIAMYSPKHKLKALAAKAKPLPSLLDTWRLFMVYKQYTVCENTLQRYDTTTKAIYHLGLNQRNWQAVAIKNDLLKLLPDNRKRVTKHLIALSLWAWNYDYIDNHLLAKLKLDESKSAAKATAKPFSASQRDQLLAYMLQHEHYSYYYAITLFMFHTGCRPCEAVGLQWQDVDLERKQLTLGRSVVYLSNGTTQERAVSKTGGTRVFPFNKALSELFYLPGGISTDEGSKPVFPAKSGGYLKFDNYRRRAWKNCVTDIALDASVYTPYSMRDTFITLALDKGYAVRDIAKLCDNSPDIIYRHYAGWVREVTAMEI
jgi:integrase